MKKTVLLIFITLLLSGCSSKQEVQQEIQIDKMFVKKQECQSYSNKVLEMRDKYINGFSLKVPGEWFSDQGIFYSPKFNSCVYHFMVGFTPDVGSVGGKDFSTAKIGDYLSGQILFSASTLSGMDSGDLLSSYDKYVREYKEN